jgi:hypothetical protein
MADIMLITRIVCTITHETPNYVSDPATRYGGTWGERRHSSYSFLTSALDRGEWSASRPGRALPLGKEPPVPIVHEAGLDAKARGKILCLCWGSNPGRPVRSQTLY